PDRCSARRGRQGSEGARKADRSRSIWRCSAPGDGGGPGPRNRRWRPGLPSEGLPDRNVDGDLRLALAAVDRRCDVEPDRAKIGIDAAADSDAEAQIVETGELVFIDLAGIDEGDGAVIAEAVAAFDRKFGKAAAAERDIGGVARAELLIAEAPDRAAAAGI